jgi:hypothetical protein
MDPFLEFHRSQTRRQFFGQTGLRAGSIALASMMGTRVGAVPPWRTPCIRSLPGLPHFAPKAKRSSTCT